MTYFLWACYLLGGLFSLLKRANLSAAKDYTPWQNMRQYCAAHSAQILINFLLSTALFWTVWHDTSSLAGLLRWVGVEKDFDVPLNPFTAALYGVFSDVVMDFIVAKLSGRFGSKS